MKVKITNFGPVKGKQKAIIDLSKGMTLITGANGLGKTYLGYLVYGLIKRLKKPNLELKNDDLLKEEGNSFNNNEFTIPVTQALLNKYFELQISSYVKQLHQFLGLERKVSDQIFKGLSIQVLDVASIFEIFIEGSYEGPVKIMGKEVFNFKSGKGSSDIIFTVTNVKSDISLPRELIANTIFSKVINESVLKESLISRVFYIPVERIALYTFVNELSSKRSEKLDMVRSLLMDDETDIPEYLRKNVNRYPEAITDALQQAGDLSQITKNEADSDFVELAEEIERDILDGSIEISSNGEVEFSPKKGGKKRVPVHLSASFIKAISGIILFLKHTATKNDMLMIDEPEMNLHPNMQVLLMRILAKVSNAGIKVWMSTHSDYMTMEFNNMCLAGTLFEKEHFNIVTKMGYNEKQLIYKKNIQAFYLNPTHTSTQVKIDTLEVKDDGVDIESIDSCISKLNYRTNELQEFYENMDF